MEKSLNSHQEKLLELQEQYCFAELSAEDQAFVLQHSSEEVFNLAHALLTESKHLFALPDPKPLVVPQQNKSTFRVILLPISTAAAAAILTFLFFRQETVVFKTIQTPVYLTADTVYIHERQVDTVLQEIPVRQPAKRSKVKLNNNPNYSVPTRTESREEFQPITRLNSKNKGESADEDKTVGLIENVAIL